MASVSCSFNSFSVFLLSLKQQQNLMKIMFSCIHFPTWPYPPPHPPKNNNNEKLYFILVNYMGWQVCNQQCGILLVKIIRYRNSFSSLVRLKQQQCSAIWPERERERERERVCEVDGDGGGGGGGEICVRIWMIYSFRPFSLMKGCRWMTYLCTTSQYIL